MPIALIEISEKGINELAEYTSEFTPQDDYLRHCSALSQIFQSEGIRKEDAIEILETNLTLLGLYGDDAERPIIEKSIGKMLNSTYNKEPILDSWVKFDNLLTESGKSVKEKNEIISKLRNLIEPPKTLDDLETVEEILNHKHNNITMRLEGGSKPFPLIYEYLQWKYDIIRQKGTMQTFILKENGGYKPLDLVDLHIILSNEWKFKFSLRDAEKLIDYIDNYPEAEKNIIQFKNCYLDINTLKEVNETKIFCQRIINWDYIPGTRSIILESELKEMLQDDYIYFLMMIGYLFTTHHKDEKLFFLIGERGTGKSTLGRILTLLFGTDHVSNVSLQNIAANDFQAANIINRTLNVVDDTNLGKITNVGLLNSIASGSPLEVNPKYQKTLKVNGESLPKLLVMGNSLPVIDDPAGAIYERIVLMKTHKKFRQTNNCDTDFITKLKKEDFEWLIVASIEAYSQNKWPNNTKEIERNTRLESDPFGVAFEDLYELTFDSSDEIHELDLQRNLMERVRFYHQKGYTTTITPLSKPKLKTLLGIHGLESKRTTRMVPDGNETQREYIYIINGLIEKPLESDKT